MIKIIKVGTTYIQIADIEGEDDDGKPIGTEIYSGTPDVDCILEAVLFYYGEDEVSREERDVPPEQDLTDTMKLHDMDPQDPEGEPIQIERREVTDEDRARDWPDDDE